MLAAKTNFKKRKKIIVLLLYGLFLMRIMPTIAIAMMMAMAAAVIVIVKPEIVAKFDVETAVGKGNIVLS